MIIEAIALGIVAGTLGAFGIAVVLLAREAEPYRANRAVDPTSIKPPPGGTAVRFRGGRYPIVRDDAALGEHAQGFESLEDG